MFAFSVGAPYLKFLSFPEVQPGSQTSITDNAQFTAAEFQAAERLSGLYDASNPNLTAFRNAGGKLIMWQGWADTAISPFGTTDYYTAMVQRMGGLGATQQFARLFMIPGVYHCGFGGTPNATTSLDLIDPILNWVENGAAPQSVTATLPGATATAAPIATRPIYPYPEQSQYNGSGSPLLASSYTGAPSTALPTTQWLGRFPTTRSLWCGYRSSAYVCSPGGEQGPQSQGAQSDGARHDTADRRRI